MRRLTRRSRMDLGSESRRRLPYLQYPGQSADVHLERNEGHEMAAVYAISDIVTEDELSPDYIIPGPFDPRVAPAVAAKVAGPAGLPK